MKLFKRAHDRPPPEAAVLFVCLGNICRSPTAEAVFRTVVAREGLDGRVAAASAGMGDWHVGSLPDRRAVQAAQRRGYDMSACRARQFDVVDFKRYGWILAMDQDNLDALNALKPPDYEGRLALFLDYAPQLGVREVPDPYYGAPAGFERVLDLVEVAAAALLAEVKGTLGERPA